MCTGRRGGGRAIARREAEAPEREREARGHLRLRAAPPWLVPRPQQQAVSAKRGRDHRARSALEDGAPRAGPRAELRATLPH